MRNPFLFGVQLCTYSVLVLPVRWLLRMERSGRLPRPGDGPYILAANHPTRADPFLIVLSMPPRVALSLMPVRFVTAEEYLRNPFARVLLRSLGCVSTRPRGAKTTAILIDALRRGESVCIFPSGSLDRGEAHAPARVGVVYIERHAQNAKILPVRISCVSPRVRDILLRKTHCVVHCGAPFRHRVFPSDLQPLADDVMARIRA